MRDIRLADVLGRDLDEDVPAELLAAEHLLLSLSPISELMWMYRLDHPENPPGERRRNTIQGAVVRNEAGNWRFLEYDFDVWADMMGSLFVGASLGVGCQCKTEHNMHYVAAAEWEAASSSALCRAIHLAAKQIEAWDTTGSSSEYWLHQAGLPA